MEYLTRAEAAEYISRRGLPISKYTLQKMVTTGGGPIYRIFGIRSVYLQSDLDAWVEGRLSPPRRSSSDVEARA